MVGKQLVQALANFQPLVGPAHMEDAAVVRRTLLDQMPGKGRLWPAHTTLGSHPPVALWMWPGQWPGFSPLHSFGYKKV